MDIGIAEKKFGEAAAHFEAELKNLRTGRAHISMVEDTLVEAYGAKDQLSHLASLSMPDPRSILVKPWDKSLLPAIQSALEKANPGTSAVAETDSVRISFPPMTEERRKETVKLLGKKMEEARITVRKLRDEFWKTIQDEHQAKTISEDQKFSLKSKLEKLVDEVNGKIAAVAEKKEREIMEI